MDRLSDLLQHFDLRARVFRSGLLCEVGRFDAAAGVGYLHLVRKGHLDVIDGAGQRLSLHGPSVVFCPRPVTHMLDAHEDGGAELVSASIEFGQGDENPMLRGLPDMLVVPLADMPDLAPLIEVLSGEAVVRRCGHAAVVDRLTEVLVVKLLRLAIERRLIDRGLVAGLADFRLAKALTALHGRPDESWTLDRMAQYAGMSRSRFAAHFTTVIGIPAGEYLKQWRVGLAKSLLRRGQPVKQVALEVGYGSSATFGRAFEQVVGASPSVWVQRISGRSTVHP